MKRAIAAAVATAFAAIGALGVIDAGAGPTRQTAAPINLTITPGNGSLALAWGVNTTEGLGGWKVNWKPTTTTAWSTALLSGSARSYTITGLTNGVKYEVQDRALVAGGVLSIGGTPAGEAPKEEPKPTGKEQTTWAAVGAPILTDAQAAALVIHKPEIRTYDAEANNYEPTAAEVAKLREGERDQYGNTNVQENPYAAFVDGKDGLLNPSTDDLIQWACDKWGIPVESCRAVMVDESWWRQRTLGDRAVEPPRCVEQAPAYARINATEVYESLGISQVKHRCAESSGAFNYPVGVGTEPARWKSTAFALDYFCSVIRFYRDNPEGKRSAWGDSSYKAGETWGALGEWFSPYPANNSGALKWIEVVQKYEAEKFWTKPEFVNG